MLGRSSIITMSFGRSTFRRSLPHTAMHGRKCCAARSSKSGWIARDPVERNESVQEIRTSIVAAMRTQQGVPESRCQPGANLVFAQVVSDRCDQLVENIRVNFVERVVIENGKIISIRKLGGTFSVGVGTIEKFYNRPKRGSG